ncbi:MAG: hypothetical protein ACTSR2_02540 [Candidatus Hodarchaeales archaeon]
MPKEVRTTYRGLDMFSRGAIDTTLSTSNYETVETGVVENLTEEKQLSVVSTDTNDTLLGTGANKIKLTYLDADFNQYEEIIELNGTTPVLTSGSNIMHIEKFEVCKVGSNIWNKGIISLKDDAIVIAKIEAGKNSFFSCVHHVPVGKVCYVTGFQYFSRTTGAVEVRLTYEKDFVGGGKVTMIYDEEIVNNYNSLLKTFLSPLKVEAGNHIRVEAKAKLENQEVGIRLFCFEEDAYNG